MENLLQKATDLFKEYQEYFHKTTDYKFVFEAWIDEPQLVTVKYSYGILGKAVEDERVFAIIQEYTVYVFCLLLEEIYTKIIYELVAGE